MNAKKDLEYFLNLKYDVVLKRKGTRFVLFITELSVCEEDEIFEKAYEELELAKKRYFQKMIDLGFMENIKEPKVIKNKKTFITSFVTSLLLFFCKAHNSSFDNSFCDFQIG